MAFSLFSTSFRVFLGGKGMRLLSFFGGSSGSVLVLVCILPIKSLLGGGVAEVV